MENSNDSNKMDAKIISFLEDEIKILFNNMMSGKI
jgi:hypothetical protein